MSPSEQVYLRKHMMRVAVRPASRVLATAGVSEALIWNSLRLQVENVKRSGLGLRSYIRLLQRGTYLPVPEP